MSAPFIFDTAQVAKFALVSLRQLQWWDEQGVVRPHHEGHKRFYDAADVTRALIVAALRKRGLALSRMPALLKPALLKQLNGDAVGEQFLVGNSKSIRLIPNRGKVIDLLKEARVPLFVLSVPDVLQPLHEAMRPAAPANGIRPRGKRR
jgi:DNA-binding transcriptional MerR regulator